MRFQLFSFLIFFFFVSAVSHPKQKSLVASRKDGFLIIFCIFCFPPPPMHCCCIWNMSWFWASQIKANALIYCHRYCNSVIHTSSTSADFQPFKWRIMAYGRFWSASPAGEENQLIFRAHLFCVDPKLSRTWTFLFFFLPFLFSFFFCTTTKHSKAPPRKAQSRISLHTFQTTMMIWDRSVRCNHLSSDPMSPSFYHCQNQSSAFHSQK